MTASWLGRPAQVDQCMASRGVREGQVGMLCQKFVDVAQRLNRPVETLQAQRECIAHTRVAGRNGNSALEQSQRILGPVLALEPHGECV